MRGRQGERKTDNVSVNVCERERDVAVIVWEKECKRVRESVSLKREDTFND